MKKFFYRVQKDDSLLGLSNRFEVPIFKLISENNLKKEIDQGDILIITPTQSSFYTVQPFDTLASVLTKFCLSESEFIEKNGNIPYLFYGLKINV